MSHLYPGFRYVDRLPLVIAQRNVQRQIIGDLLVNKNIRSILSIGCGYGDELASILPDDIDSLHVCAIDVADVEKDLRLNGFAKRLNSRLIWCRLDLMDLTSVPWYGEFDLIQCGFVLHDVEHGQKNHAVRLLSRAVKLGGHILVSDIFLSGNVKFEFQVRNIYDAFLAEANAALKLGTLTPNQWRMLLGDGDQLPGLLCTKEEACVGNRDFFDNDDTWTQRALEVGLSFVRRERNPLNPMLRIDLMKRSVTD